MKGGITHLAITKEKKDALYATYLKVLDGVPGMVITEYRGMTMQNLNTIRSAVRPAGGIYSVVKSTIFKKVLSHYGFAVPDDLLAGPVAIAIAKTDLAKVTKALMDIKDVPTLVLKGAIFGDAVFKESQLEAVSQMPTFEQARASLLGTLTAPASQLVSLLAEPASSLARILKAYSDKQQGGDDAAA